MPRKISELTKDYIKAGATVDESRGKGSHRKIKHPNYPSMMILSGKAGADAKKYQERDLKNFLTQIDYAD